MPPVSQPRGCGFKSCPKHWKLFDNLQKHSTNIPESVASQIFFFSSLSLSFATFNHDSIQSHCYSGVDGRDSKLHPSLNWVPSKHKHTLSNIRSHTLIISLSLPISSTLTIHSHSLLYNKHSLSLSNIHPPWSSLDKGESLACTHNHVASFSLSNTHTYSHPPSHSHILSISLLQILPTPWSS